MMPGETGSPFRTISWATQIDPASVGTGGAVGSGALGLGSDTAKTEKSAIWDVGQRRYRIVTALDAARPCL